jgi:dihydroflavonol-4-reductase
MTTYGVTGASGFVAAHLVKLLLADGHAVRGSTRTAAPHLQSLPGAEHGLQLFAANLMTPGSFGTMIHGCDLVFHTASPYQLTVRDPQRDLLQPAVEGTLNVLRACAAKPSVRRVVLTSSVAAITDEPPQDHVLTEADWNEQSSLTRNAYYYSKTMAERAAWEFMAREKPGFDLVVINPFIVMGPSLSPGLNESNKIIVDLLAGLYPSYMNLEWGTVDVRDVALAHYRAAQKPQASGRYLCANECLPMRAFVELLREAGYDRGYRLPKFALPDFAIRLGSWLQPKGAGDYLRSHIGRQLRYSNQKIKAELGMEFRPLKTTLRDTLEDLSRRSLLPTRA